MDWRRRQSNDGLQRRPLYGSLAVHAGVAVLALLFSLSRPEPMQFESFQVQIIQAPPPDQVSPEEVQAAEDFVVDTPEPEPPAPEPQPVEETPAPLVEDVEEVPEPEPDPPEPDVEEEDQTPPPPPPEEEEVVPATTTETAEEESELSGEEIAIRWEGLQRDYPAYYDNIVLQIRRCFRPPNVSNRETTIYFEIRADGTTINERFEERSGNSSLDFGALAAIADCAGPAAAFGPLPDDLPYERLPVLFSFSGREDG